MGGSFPSYISSKETTHTDLTGHTALTGHTVLTHRSHHSVQTRGEDYANWEKDRIADYVRALEGEVLMVRSELDYFRTENKLLRESIDEMMGAINRKRGLEALSRSKELNVTPANFARDYIERVAQDARHGQQDTPR